MFHTVWIYGDESITILARDDVDGNQQTMFDYPGLVVAIPCRISQLHVIRKKLRLKLLGQETSYERTRSTLDLILPVHHVLLVFNVTEFCFNNIALPLPQYE